MTYRDRRAARAERLREWAQKREAKAATAFNRVREIGEHIPAGQPVLVGHHSEARARADIARMDSGMRASVESSNLAASMRSRADNIEAAADHAIYSDDPDAVERLSEKIAGLEAQRARITAINKAVRKGGLEAARALLHDGEYSDLVRTATLQPYHQVEKRGYPSYVLSNLSGNLSRLRKRLASLGGPSVPSTPDLLCGATATARAGIVVTPSMTTPSKSGKAPRPVWIVSGALAEWRQFLLGLGGRWYRRAFSFYDDPTAEIEQACAEAEGSE